MFLIYINKKPIQLQLSEHACVRFGHLYGRDVSDGTQLEMQRWDRLNQQYRKRKGRNFHAKNVHGIFDSCVQG